MRPVPELIFRSCQKNFTGYHQIKGFVNNIEYDVIQSLDLRFLRYAEVLLNYAEARSRTGELTQADLDLTINILRDRAGMPHLTMNPPVDAVQDEIPRSGHQLPNGRSCLKSVVNEE